MRPGANAYVKKFSELIGFEEGGQFLLNRDNLRHNRYGQVWPFTQKFLDAFGPARKRDEQIREHHRDLAYALQVCTEETILHVLRALAAVHPSRNLYLTGCVALNCVANARILRDSPYERVWVPPCASDSGAPLGSALWHHHQTLGFPRQFQVPVIADISGSELQLPKMTRRNR
jgi:carbamoyltransferase